jgi:outer membrane protein assembly factor BamE (lipoprotein component of BamABCDE complex)
MIMKKFVLFSIIVFLVCILTSGCKNIRESRISNHKETLNQAGFDRDYWINDSLGCNPDKKGKNAKIFINQNFIKNCTKSEIIELLGNPHKVQQINGEVNYYYVVDGRLSCDILKLLNLIVNADNSYLVINFNKRGRLTIAYLIVK